MKAAIYPGEGKSIVIEDIPEPEVRPGDLLVKVERCGICGTDLSMTKGEMFDFGKGSQFGHEYAGEVVALGSDVTGFSIGDRVSALPSGACGHCAGCFTHNHVMCQNVDSLMAGFAEYIRIPTNVAVKLPQVLSFADGALIEPLAVSLYGANHSGMKAGDDVLVLGGGTVALYTIYWARRLGARRIAAMSRSERRKDLCLAMGADTFIPYGDNEIGEVIEALGGSPDLVYECVGAEGMLGKAVMHVKLGGKVVSLGFCTSPDSVIPGIASYKLANLQFLVGYTMKEFHYIAEQMDKGHVDPKTIITNEIPLAGLPDMMQHLRGANDETKVHVRIAG